MKSTETQELIMGKMAQVGYESYAAYARNKSPGTGDSLPKWEDLPEQLHNAWLASADGMTNFLANVGSAPEENYVSRIGIVLKKSKHTTTFSDCDNFNLENNIISVCFQGSVVFRHRAEDVEKITIVLVPTFKK